ncbi:MAG: formate dehydrogenase accessory protein FdhE [Burkholderiales bacterium]|nr:formate dehydrogenase accessory protein FdhE [Burkholderiales bacterium]
MVTAQAARLLTPEEIAVQAGQQVPFLRLPDPATLFAEREARLRTLAAGHATRDFLLFAAELTRAQHALLQRYPELPTPDAQAIEAAAQAGRPPLPALHWPRDAAWRRGLHDLLDELLPRLVGSPALGVVQALRAQGDAALEQQADRLLSRTMRGLDLGAAPLIAAALQVYWTALVLQTEATRLGGRPAPFGRTDDETRCPCCGSHPTASISRIGADVSGYRYLHCSLCAAQWHMVRVKCAACRGTKGIGYQSLEALPGHALPATGAARDAVQAETCDVCSHYLKIVHMAKDAHVDPVADDLASVTLDLLVSDAGFQRQGVNLLLLFGDPEAPPDPPPAP